MSTQQIAQQPEQSREQRDAQLSRLVQRLHINNNIAVGILWVVAAIVAVIFVSVIVYLLIKGLAYFINPAFYDTSSAGVGREIFNTFYVLILTEILLIPVALAAAIYLNEYARQGLLVTAIHFAAETLAGVPTIVLGLFALDFLWGCVCLKMHLFQYRVNYVRVVLPWERQSGMLFVPLLFHQHCLELSRA
ncbi:MAG: hypothetical protein NVS9B9_18120 [Ktedonobacteraceae bacterium]